MLLLLFINLSIITLFSFSNLLNFNLIISFSPARISFNFFVSLNLFSKSPISSADFQASSNCVLSPSVFSSILGYKIFNKLTSLSPLLNMQLNKIFPIILLFSSKKVINLFAKYFCNSN